MKCQTALNNDLIENESKEVKNQALASEMDGDKCTLVGDDMSLSRPSISVSVRLASQCSFYLNEGFK